MKKGIIIVFAAVMLLSSALYADLAVTVYNQNLGVVKDQRSIDFQKGKFEYSLVDVPSQIDPTSVHFKLLQNPDAAALLEQNYRYDLVGFNKILDKYIDKTIEMVHEDGRIYSGTLLSHDGNTVTLMKPDNSLEVVQTEKITKFDFPKLPEGLITKPTLVWLFDSELSGSQDAEVSYMTKGMNWHAEYVGVISQKDDYLDISAWVSIENNSGATFKDAKLKLVAGDLNLVPDRPVVRREPVYVTGEIAQAARGFEEKAFFEYHLYTLPRTTSLANKEIKQISLFEPTTTPVDKKYVYTGRSDVKVNLEFMNSEENGMGMPLPAGKVRIMKRDSDNALEFVGEDRLDHTPRDEKVELFLGNAFDLVGERIVHDVRVIAKGVSEEDVEIKLRNHKEDEEVEIIVRLRLPRSKVKILKSNFEYNRVDAHTVEFVVPVKPDEEKILTYTVRTES
ncbi:MAG: hypothetical protein GF310_04930 [candidate division Zixibacteria bacterium]|nr:hypothetical protein [candidate division Zixibacteria bacterium]